MKDPGAAEGLLCLLCEDVQMSNNNGAINTLAGLRNINKIPCWSNNTAANESINQIIYVTIRASLSAAAVFESSVLDLRLRFMVNCCVWHDSATCCDLSEATVPLCPFRSLQRAGLFWFPCRSKLRQLKVK